jgi:uncharacterized protein (TIRG00374 family)
MEVKKLKFFLKIIITVGLVSAILFFVGFDKFTMNFEMMDVAYVFLAFPFSVLIVFLGSEKWRYMIKHEAVGVTLKNSIVSFLGGASLGLITPGRIGELGRVIFISQGTKSALAGIALVDKLIDLEATLLLGIWSMYIFFGKFNALTLACVVVMIGAIIVYPGRFRGLMEKSLGFLPYKSKVKSLISGITSIPKRTLIRCFLYRLLVSIIDLFQFYLLLNSFTPIPISSVFAVYPIIVLTNIIPLTFMGIGVREGAAMLTLSRFGVQPEVAATSSFILFCFNTLLPGIIGAVFVSQVKIELKKIRMRAA